MLAIENITVNYGPIVALRDLSLTVSKGEIVALLGPNGAGKSTALKAIMGMQPLKSGQIMFEGKSINGLATENIVRRGMTMTPEGRRVFADLTVDENLILGAVAQKDKHAAEITKKEIFKMFPILEERRNQRSGTLSGGQQQQLAIGRSLMSAPRLLLLDEPSLGLAPLVVEQIFMLIQELKQKGNTILLVEQNTELSLAIADRGYICVNGRIEISGTSRQLAASSDVVNAYLGIEEKQD